MTRATQPASFVLAAMLGVALIAAPGPVSAQVTVDLHALDAPSTGNGTTEHPVRKPAPRRQTRRPVAHAPAHTGHKEAAKAEPAAPKHEAVTAAPAAPSAPAASGQAAAKPAAATPPPAATLPSAAPPEVSLTPDAPPIPAPTVPAPVPSAALPASTTTATADGLRVEFPPGESAVGPASTAALKQLAAAARAKSASASFNVVAYAPGDPSDPSTSRRLSLSRALAVRASLIAAGVDGANIYVRALGEPPANAPGGADRADVAVLGANIAGPAAATRPPATPAPAASAPPAVTSAVPPAASTPPATAEPPLTPSRPPTSPLPGAVR